MMLHNKIYFIISYVTYLKTKQPLLVMSSSEQKFHRDTCFSDIDQ